MAYGSTRTTENPPPAHDLADRARSFRRQMSVIDSSTEIALDMTRDRFGRTVHPRAAAAARAHRDRAAVDAYTVHLAPYAVTLLDTARRALSRMPPAPHLAGWQTVLDCLAVSAAEIRQALDQPAAHGTAAEHDQHAALWPHLARWADHGYIASDLADQEHHQQRISLTDEEQQMWTDMAHAAHKRGDLEPIESWFSADGKRIVMAHLGQEDEWTLVALQGSPDAPGWKVIGHYDHEYQARHALPPPVPPGVLRPDTSRYNRPAPAPEIPVQELLRNLVNAQNAQDASSALVGAITRGHDTGPMVRLHELLLAAAEFANALETVQGRAVGARLAALGETIDHLMRDVLDAAVDLEATVAVLPPHRTPLPRAIPHPPAAATTPPARTSNSTTSPHR